LGCCLVLGEKMECPCEDQSLCSPLKIGPRPELFLFQVDSDTWEGYDWTYITTVVMFGTFNSSMLCKAHAENARVVWGTSFPVDQLSNRAARDMYVKELVNQVRDTYTDGVNIDIEDAIAANSRDRDYLTLLVSEIYIAFQNFLPGTQVTFDVAWDPDCIDGRCYDYIGLAKYTDFLVIMGYDLQSQVFGECVAAANSPQWMIYEGIFDYMSNYGISADQLVLGVPWYGYDYPCLNSDSDNQTVCDIALVPFRGVNCSDAAGTQKMYQTIMQLVYNSSTGRMWSEEMQSPWFNYMDGEGVIHQVWYDDPESLATKYNLAKKLGLRGLSMWNVDCLYYGEETTGQAETEAMWNALDFFFEE